MRTEKIIPIKFDNKDLEINVGENETEIIFSLSNKKIDDILDNLIEKEDIYPSLYKIIENYYIEDVLDMYDDYDIEHYLEYNRDKIVGDNVKDIINENYTIEEVCKYLFDRIKYKKKRIDKEESEKIIKELAKIISLLNE